MNVCNELYIVKKKKFQSIQNVSIICSRFFSDFVFLKRFTTERNLINTSILKVANHI